MIIKRTQGTQPDTAYTPLSIRLGACLLALSILLAGCRYNQEAERDLPSPEAIVEATPESIAPTPSGTPEPSPGAASIQPENNVYEVHNYREFIQAMGSDREIRLLPGDYDPKSFNAAQNRFDHIKNLTLTGVPWSGESYIYFYSVHDTNSGLIFANCSNITISNIEFSHGGGVYQGQTLSFTGCKDITINNCRILEDMFQGLVINDTENLTMNDSILTGKVNALIDINETSRNITFNNCQVTANGLRIRSFSYSIAFINCSLSGFVWSESILQTGFISHPTGFESDWDTMSWNSDQTLLAFYRSDYLDGPISFRNTYRGDRIFFMDGRFMKLVSAIGLISNEIALSVDEDREGNMTLKIHFMDGQQSETPESFLSRISVLKPALKEIQEMGLPITLILHRGFNAFEKMAAVSLSLDQFTKAISDLSQLAGLMDRVVPISDKKALTSVPDTYRSAIINRLAVFTGNNSKLMYRNEDPSIRYMCSEWGNGGIWDYYAIETQTEMADTRTYQAELIFKASRTTDEIFLADEYGLYKLSSFGTETMSNIGSIIGNSEKVKLDKYNYSSIALEQVGGTDDGNYQVYCQTYEYVPYVAGKTPVSRVVYHHYIVSVDTVNQAVTDVRPYQPVGYKERSKHDAALISAEGSLYALEDPVALPPSFDREGEYLYFTNHYDQSSIYRMKPDGSGLQKVVNDKASYLVVKDGWIFYAYKNGFLKKCRVDGSELKVYENIPVLYDIIEADGIIYFPSMKFGRKTLKIMKADGTWYDDMSIDQHIQDVFKVDRWIYFNTLYDDGKVTYRFFARKHLDTVEYQAILKLHSRMYWADASGIYYRLLAEKDQPEDYWMLYRMPLDGGDSEALFPCYDFKIDQNGDYYYVYGGLYCMNRNGEVTTLVDEDWGEGTTIQVLDDIIICSIANGEGEPQKITIVNKDSH